MSKYLLGGRKSVSEPASGVVTPKTTGNDSTDPVFNPISEDEPPHLEGHPGYLNEAQVEALKVFKEKLASAGLYRAASETDDSDASHDEVTLL